LTLTLVTALALRADLGARQGRGGGGAPAGPPAPDPIPNQRLRARQIIGRNQLLRFR